MSENLKVFESLLERATEFGKTSYQLAKLKSVDKISTVISRIIVSTLFFTIFFTVLLFANLGLAFFLGEILGNSYYGFFIIGAFYFLFGILGFILFHKIILRSVGNYIINQLLN